MAEERVQRRLAAIVSADVVGYSKMMGQDEAGTLARLKSLRAEFLHPKITEYGGRIVKTTGDGTLIEFGSAVDAVSHAVDVQRGMAERNADLPEEQQIHLRLGSDVSSFRRGQRPRQRVTGTGHRTRSRVRGCIRPPRLRVFPGFGLHVDGGGR